MSALVDGTERRLSDSLAELLSKFDTSTELGRLRIFCCYIDVLACEVVAGRLDPEKCDAWAGLIETCAAICTEHGENPAFAIECAGNCADWVKTFLFKRLPVAPEPGSAASQCSHSTLNSDDYNEIGFALEESEAGVAESEQHALSGTRVGDTESSDRDNETQGVALLPVASDSSGAEPGSAASPLGSLHEDCCQCEHAGHKKGSCEDDGCFCLHECRHPRGAEPGSAQLSAEAAEALEKGLQSAHTEPLVYLGSFSEPGSAVAPPAKKCEQCVLADSTFHCDKCGEHHMFFHVGHCPKLEPAGAVAPRCVCGHPLAAHLNPAKAPHCEDCGDCIGFKPAAGAVAPPQLAFHAADNVVNFIQPEAGAVASESPRDALIAESERLRQATKTLLLAVLEVVSPKCSANSWKALGEAVDAARAELKGGGT